MAEAGAPGEQPQPEPEDPGTVQRPEGEDGLWSGHEPGPGGDPHPPGGARRVTDPLGVLMRLADQMTAGRAVGALVPAWRRRTRGEQRWPVTASVIVAIVVLAGCGSGTDDRPVTWSYISTAIIEPSCATASCHSEAAQRAGVILSDSNKAYTSLVDRHFVIKGDQSISEVMALMRAVGARRMPPDFPLPEADVELIGKWIDQGANKN